MNMRNLLNKLKKMESSIVAIYEGETDEYFYFEERGESLDLTDSELNRLYDNAEQYRKIYEKFRLLSEKAFEDLLDSLDFIESCACYLFGMIELGYVDVDGDVHLLAALASCSTEIWKEETV